MWRPKGCLGIFSLTTLFWALSLIDRNFRSRIQWTWEQRGLIVFFSTDDTRLLTNAQENNPKIVVMSKTVETKGSKQKGMVCDLWLLGSCQSEYAKKSTPIWIKDRTEGLKLQDGPIYRQFTRKSNVDVQVGPGKQLVLRWNQSAIAKDFHPHTAVIRRHFLHLQQVVNPLPGCYWKIRSRPIGVRVSFVAQFDFFSTAFDPREWTMVVLWKEDAKGQVRLFFPASEKRYETSSPSQKKKLFLMVGMFLMIFLTHFRRLLDFLVRQIHLGCHQDCPLLSPPAGGKGKARHQNVSRGRSRPRSQSPHPPLKPIPTIDDDDDQSQQDEGQFYAQAPETPQTPPLIQPMVFQKLATERDENVGRQQRSRSREGVPVHVLRSADEESAAVDPRLRDRSRSSQRKKVHKKPSNLPKVKNHKSITSHEDDGVPQNEHEISANTQSPVFVLPLQSGARKGYAMGWQIRSISSSQGPSTSTTSTSSQRTSTSTSSEDESTNNDDYGEGESDPAVHWVMTQEEQCFIQTFAFWPWRALDNDVRSAQACSRSRVMLFRDYGKKENNRISTTSLLYRLCSDHCVVWSTNRAAQAAFSKGLT